MVSSIVSVLPAPPPNFCKSGLAAMTKARATQEFQAVAMILDNLCSLTEAEYPVIHVGTNPDRAFAFMRTNGIEVHIACTRNACPEISLTPDCAPDLSRKLKLSEEKVAEILAIIARPD